jgi:hypothetical protein
VTDTARIEDAHHCPNCGAPPLHWEHEDAFQRTGTEGNLTMHPTGRTPRRRLVADWEDPE